MSLGPRNCAVTRKPSGNSVANVVDTSSIPPSARSVSEAVKSDATAIAAATAAPVALMIFVLIGAPPPPGGSFYLTAVAWSDACSVCSSTVSASPTAWRMRSTITSSVTVPTSCTRSLMTVLGTLMTL